MCNYISNSLDVGVSKEIIVHIAMAFFLNNYTLAISSSSENTPVSNDWLTILVRGFTKAKAGSSNNLTQNAIMTCWIFVLSEAKYLVTAFSSTRFNQNWVRTCFLGKFHTLFLFFALILSANLGPTLEKNQLNVLHISVLFVIVLDSPLIFFFNSFPFTALFADHFWGTFPCHFGITPVSMKQLVMVLVFGLSNGTFLIRINQTLEGHY